VAPGRSHASDGTIGDASHAASVSDHNPDSRGVVHACDVTNDPAHGFDAWQWAHVVADRIARGLEHRVKYIVVNDGKGWDQIFNPSVSMGWRQNGSAKTEHRQHVHFSVLYNSEGENDVSPFFVTVAAPSAPPVPRPATAPAGAPPPTLRLGSRGQAVAIMQALLNHKLNAHLATDGIFGRGTQDAVRQFQANVQRFFHFTQAQFQVDGICGGATWYWLGAK